MIVLDTHALVWWVNGDQRLSDAAATAIRNNRIDDAVFASSISTWELAMLVAKGKLELGVDVLSWTETVASVDGFRFVPVDNVVAVRSQTLPGSFHADPADRIIVALARELAVPLVTADAKIRDYAHVTTIW